MTFDDQLRAAAGLPAATDPTELQRRVAAELGLEPGQAHLLEGASAREWVASADAIKAGTAGIRAEHFDGGARQLPPAAPPSFDAHLRAAALGDPDPRNSDY